MIISYYTSYLASQFIMDFLQGCNIDNHSSHPMSIIGLHQGGHAEIKVVLVITHPVNARQTFYEAFNSSTANIGKLLVSCWRAIKGPSTVAQHWAVIYM